MTDAVALWKSYRYDGTDVLINKPGIRDALELRSFEEGAAYLRGVQLAREPITGHFDLRHLQQIHEQLHQDTFDWAGRLRDTPWSRPNAAAGVDQIVASAGRVHQTIRDANRLRDLSKNDFVEKLALVYSDLLAIRPFQEGNERTVRAFCSQLASQAGYVLDLRRLDEEKVRWASANAGAERGELHDLRAMLTEAVRPAASVAFEILQKDEALAQHPGLSGAYEVLERQAADIETRYKDNPKAVDHFMVRARAEVVRALDTGAAVRPLLLIDKERAEEAMALAKYGFLQKVKRRYPTSGSSSLPKAPAVR